MNEAELDLFRFLADGAYHSGEEIGALLGISRAAVWKRVNALQRASGHNIERAAGKGYQIPGGVEFLSAEAITEQLQADIDVCVLDVTDSTNEQARLASKPGNRPLAVLAEMQNSGRGRRGRQWHSPYAANLYLSLSWPLTAGMQEAEAMSLVVGLSVRNLLADYGVTAAGLKWPNDILLGNRKLAGVLLELIGDPADQGFVIIGIGINLNMTGEQADIDQPWTSVKQSIEVAISRNQLAARLIDRLVVDLERHRKHGFAGSLAEWEKHHLWQGCQVKLSTGAELITGRVVGLSEAGGLLLETEQGVQAFHGGELSLRLNHDT